MSNLSYTAGTICSSWSRPYETISGLNRDGIYAMSQLYSSSWSKAKFCRHPLDYSVFSRLACPHGDKLLVCDIPLCACATEWTKCRNGHCIPPSLFNKSIPVDILLKAEALCNGPSPVTHYEGYKRQYLHPFQFPGRPDEDPSLEDVIIPQDIIFSNKNYTLLKLLGSNNMNMSSFITALSHKRENLLLRCQWEKQKNCEHFIESFTDMVLYYTFNTNALKIYKTDKVGERASGIFLVINLA